MKWIAAALLAIGILMFAVNHTFIDESFYDGQFRMHGPYDRNPDALEDARDLII